MNKAIFVHLLATILYLLCFMYVTNGIDLSPFGRGANVFIIVMVNFIASIICIEQDLLKKNNMTQTSVEWLVNKLFGENGLILYAKVIVEAKKMHKADCINFAEQWEARCNEKNMDSKEQLYDEIYNR